MKLKKYNGLLGILSGTSQLTLKSVQKAKLDHITPHFSVERSSTKYYKLTTTLLKVSGAKVWSVASPLLGNRG